MQDVVTNTAAIEGTPSNPVNVDTEDGEIFEDGQIEATNAPSLDSGADGGAAPISTVDSLEEDLVAGPSRSNGPIQPPSPLVVSFPLEDTKTIRPLLNSRFISKFGRAGSNSFTASDCNGLG
jgi:hypothetical protein